MISANTSAPVIVVPTLMREGVGWKARVEFREAQTARSDGAVETEVAISAIVDETVYRTLIPALASKVEDRFRNLSLRVRLAHLVRRFMGFENSGRLPASTLAAAVAFEQGLNAYEELEYGYAVRSFAAAVESDPLNPLLVAWESRVARLMRRNVDAERLARQALELVSADTTPSTRLIVEAIAAESRRDVATASAQYRELREASPEDPALLMELATFLDRQGMNDEAIQGYIETLRVDSRLPEPHLRLCQIYNKITDRARAREHSQAALSRYQELRDRGGEAQTLLCMTETARSGTNEERLQAQAHADAAVRLFTELEYPYGLSRAHNYVGLAAESQGRLVDAASAWERALQATRRAGNIALEPRVLGNLGVTYRALGDFTRAVDYLSQSSKLNTGFGDEQEAARNLANMAAIRIAFSDPESAVNDVNTVLAVSRKVRDANFEVLGLQLMGERYRYAGRHEAAEQELILARSVAEQNNLDDELAAIATDLATSRIELGEYAMARDLIMPVLAVSGGQDAAHARIRLAQANTFMGDFRASDTELLRAANDLEGRSDTGMLSLLHEARGQLAYERGLLGEARTHFARAATLLTDQWPDAAAVEAQAYLALLNAIEGKSETAERMVRRSLEQATRMGRFTLQAKCRLILARVYVDTRRFEDAIELIRDVASDSDRKLGPEVLAQAHYLRSQAMTGSGDSEGSRMERELVAKLLAELRASLADGNRPQFDARFSIRSLSR